MLQKKSSLCDMYVKSPNTKHNTYSNQPRDKCMKLNLKNTYSMQQTLADTGGLFLKHHGRQIWRLF